MFEVDNKPNNHGEQELNPSVLRPKVSTISIALYSAYIKMVLNILSYVLRTKDYIRKNFLSFLFIEVMLH